MIILASIYVSGSEMDIGSVLNVSKKNNKMSVVIPGVSDGEAPEILKMGDDYLSYTIDVRFFGTQSEINTFESTLKTYCLNLQACVYVNTGSVLGSGINCVFYDWTTTENNSTTSYRDFSITLYEASAIVV